MTVDARPSMVSHTYGDGDIVVPRAPSIRRLSIEHGNNATNQANAKSAFDTEKTVTVRQAIRLYKKAIMFSMAMSLAVVMEG
jgi:SP family general alpha glucoside:H+ symporter-like MFS transporter